MRAFTTLSFLCLANLAMSSCSTLPTMFTNESLMKVHQGMSSDEILALFGQPQDIDIRVCGMPPSQWTCTTWGYEVFPEGNARFTFAGEPDSLILNNFDVDRE